MVDGSTSLTLGATAPEPYVHLDSRALVLCNGTGCLMLPAAQFRWARETFALIASERRATRSQGEHILGGFADGDGVVLFAGSRDGLVSVRLAADAFGALRDELGG